MGKKLVSKRAVGIKRVFDLDVCHNHNFIANDTMVHNCTEKGAQRFFETSKPRSIIDIAALTSIYRPGPLAADVDKIYNEAKANPDAVAYEHPALKEVLESTYGCLSGDTLILTDSGEFTIQYIVENIADFIGVSLPSFDTGTDEIVKDRIVAGVLTGVKPVVRITTEHGMIELTNEHVVFTARGEIPANELTINDKIFVINN